MECIYLAKINKTPVFRVRNSKKRKWGEVFGALYLDSKNQWIFPAFPPFLQTVLQDLYKVNPNITFSPAAQEWIDNIPDLKQRKNSLSMDQFKTKPYDHQYDGVAELLHNYRWILHWETGTGKSKVIIDTAQILNQKTLILCTLAGLQNWLNEIQLHSSLSAISISGKTRVAKRDNIATAIDYDVLITTYDTARKYGVPHLFKPVVELFLKAQRFPHTQLKDILIQTSDVQLQQAGAQMWLKGARPKTIKQYIQQTTSQQLQWISEYPYHIIVGDESHYLKNMQSGRTSACLELSKKATRRVLTTGTLSPAGDPRDLYPQLRFLAPYLMPQDYAEFCKQHVIFSKYNQHLAVGFKNLDIVNKKVSDMSSIRKLNDCVSLPPRQFFTLKFSLTKEQRNAYNTMVNEWIVLMQGIKKDTMTEEAAPLFFLKNAAIRVNKLLQVCSGFIYVPRDISVCETCPENAICAANFILPGNCKHTELFSKDYETYRFTSNPKLALLEDKLTEILPKKVIIWGQFTEELDNIESMLKKNKWKYVRVDGSNTHKIDTLIRRFQTDSDCSIYLGQISTAISINLTAAKYTIYYSRSWSLDHRIQSLGRNYRIGQTQKTIVYDLLADNTLEIQQLNALHNKRNVAKMLTHNPNCVLCKHYEDCQKQSIIPWGTGCVFSRSASREIAQATNV